MSRFPVPGGVTLEARSGRLGGPIRCSRLTRTGKVPASGPVLARRGARGKMAHCGLGSSGARFLAGRRASARPGS
eukprot:597258-Hanusia_phi.AAC.1